MVKQQAPNKSFTEIFTGLLV